MKFLRTIALALILFTLGEHSLAATIGVIADPATSTAMTNGMLTAGSGNTKIKTTAISHLGGTNLVIPGYVTLSGQTNQIADNGATLTYNGSAVGSGTNNVQVLSGFYSGGLPTDTPTTSAALAYDLDPPGVLYFWDGVIWY